MKLKPDYTNSSKLREAASLISSVIYSLQGEFTVEHLKAAEKWNDRFECLKWAVEAQATVAEMKAWHRAQNGLDLFAEEHDDE